MVIIINIGICDDFHADRLQIKNYLDDYCINNDIDITIVNFENGEDLESHYSNKESSFDIIFLDIYMSGKNGIATAKQIRKYDTESKIVFTTSSIEHALESFEVFPFNYLIKPIKKSEFNLVFEKAIKTIQLEKQKSLTVKLGATIQTVFYKDVLFVESNARTVTIHLAKSEKISFLAKLDDIQQQMNDNRFVRCHKSYLVNMDYVLSIENYSFKLVDKAQIPVTQRNFTNIKKLFYDYILDMSNINRLD